MAALIICRPGYIQQHGALFLVFSIACLPVVYSTAYATGGNKTDRLALLKFKPRITADPLGIMSTWNDSTDICHWFGVTCGKCQQRVTNLILRSMQLGGSISPHVGNLTFSRMVNLDNNTLINQIPPEKGYLRRLEILYLRNNSLSSEIPSTLSRCAELVILSLVSNMTSGAIPKELGLLSKLQDFSVNSNNLTGTKELKSKPDHLQYSDSTAGYEDAIIMLTVKDNNFVTRPPPFHASSSLSFCN